MDPRYYPPTYWPDQLDDQPPNRLPPLHEYKPNMCFGCNSHNETDPWDAPRRRTQQEKQQSRQYDNRTNPHTYHGMPTTIGSGRIFTDRINYPAPGREHETMVIMHPLKGQDCHRLRVNELRGMLADIYEIRARRTLNAEMSGREDEARSRSIEIVEAYLEREEFRRGNDPGW